MKKLVFIMLSLCMLTLSGGFTQVAEEEKAVRELIAQVFKAMAKGDSSMLHATFTPGATMVSVYRDKSNEPVLKRDASLDPFLKAIGTPHPEPYYEEIWNLKVNVDGDLAQAWCDYALYVGNTFSHCGVDAFHLHKGKQGWKIFHLADTRRKTVCDMPKEIQDKHK